MLMFFLFALLPFSSGVSTSFTEARPSSLPLPLSPGISARGHDEEAQGVMPGTPGSMKGFWSQGSTPRGAVGEGTFLGTPDASNDEMQEVASPGTPHSVSDFWRSDQAAAPVGEDSRFHRPSRISERRGGTRINREEFPRVVNGLDSSGAIPLDSNQWEANRAEPEYIPPPPSFQSSGPLSPSVTETRERINVNNRLVAAPESTKTEEERNAHRLFRSHFVDMQKHPNRIPTKPLGTQGKDKRVESSPSPYPCDLLCGMFKRKPSTVG